MKYLIVLVITALHGQQGFAEESKANLLMKGLYEYDKTADFSNDPEGKKKADAFKKDYEEMQRWKKALADKRREVEIWQEAIKISEERQKLASDNIDVYHELELRIAKRYRVSQEAAHKMIESDDPRVKTVRDVMVRESDDSCLREARKRVLVRKKNAKQ